VVEEVSSLVEIVELGTYCVEDWSNNSRFAELLSNARVQNNKATGSVVSFSSQIVSHNYQISVNRSAIRKGSK
jgi:hypothetical protein